MMEHMQSGEHYPHQYFPARIDLRIRRNVYHVISNYLKGEVLIDWKMKMKQRLLQCEEDPIYNHLMFIMPGPGKYNRNGLI